VHSTHGHANHSADLATCTFSLHFNSPFLVVPAASKYSSITFNAFSRGNFVAIIGDASILARCSSWYSCRGLRLGTCIWGIKLLWRHTIDSPELPARCESSRRRVIDPRWKSSLEDSQRHRGAGVSECPLIVVLIAMKASRKSRTNGYGAQKPMNSIFGACWIRTIMFFNCADWPRMDGE
jgi:hypothetical protein